MTHVNFSQSNVIGHSNIPVPHTTTSPMFFLPLPLFMRVQGIAYAYDSRHSIHTYIHTQTHTCIYFSACVFHGSTHVLSLFFPPVSASKSFSPNYGRSTTTTTQEGESSHQNSVIFSWNTTVEGNCATTASWIHLSNPSQGSTQD